jgi:hypothetical protein
MITQSLSSVIYRNNISNNNGAIATFITAADKILQNNFISNKKLSAVSHQRFLFIIMYLIVINNYLHVPIRFRQNLWDENYWNKPRSFPKIIPGWFNLRFWVDWHPAEKPYDIEV